MSYNTSLQVFNRLREDKQTDLFKKLIAVAGDVSEENLGLSLQDRTTLINQIEVVFHSAATLDFEADLRTTTNINLLGTRRIVQLCREIKDLKVNQYFKKRIFFNDLSLYFLHILCIFYAYFMDIYALFNITISYCSMFTILGTGSCL